MTAPAVAPRQRVRNPRGQGARLRDEILAAAADLLEAGPESAVTLRSVARRADITPHSIYRHFPDRDAMMLAVAEAAFDDLETRLDPGEATTDPVAALFGICTRYLDFAREQPFRYQLMFGGVWDATQALERSRTASNPSHRTDEPDRSGGLQESAVRGLGMGARKVMVDALARCVDAGRSGSRDVYADAAATWVGLHGLAQLRRTAPLFPWPDTIESDVISRLAQLQP